MRCLTLNISSDKLIDQMFNKHTYEKCDCNATDV